ncbi:MAG: glycosyltransferase [Candidatus Pacearchaeota archaeon]
MKNKQLISIVILIGPNRGKELFKAIRSVLNSTYKNYELILVDNSSNLELKNEILNKFSSVKLYTMPFNTGMVGYSIGFAKVKGKYILALDDDCTIEKNTLEKIVLAFNNLPQKVGIIATNVYNPIRKYFYYSKYVRENTRTIYTFPGGASAFKKEIFDKIGYYDNDFFCWLHEDDLAIRLINSGYEIYFDKNIIINHHDSEEYRKIRKNKFVLTIIW